LTYTNDYILAIQSTDNVQIYNRSSLEFIANVDTPVSTISYDVSTDGERFAVVGRTDNLYIYNVSNQQSLLNITLIGGIKYSSHFDGDLVYVPVSSSNMGVYIYNKTSGTSIHNITNNIFGNVVEVVTTEDYIIFTDIEDTFSERILVYNKTDYTRLANISIGIYNEALDLQVYKKLLYIYTNNRIIIYNISTPLPWSIYDTQYLHPPDGISFFVDENYIYETRSNDYLYIYNISSLATLYNRRVNNEILNTVIAIDGKVFVGSNDDNIHIFDEYLNYSELQVFDSSNTNNGDTINFSCTAYDGYTYLSNTTSSYIYDISVDNCSTYNVTAINFTAKDSTTNTDLNFTIDGYATVWHNSQSYTKSFNLSWVESDSAGICIYPDGVNYTFNGQFEYAATGYDLFYKREPYKCNK